MDFAHHYCSRSFCARATHGPTTRAMETEEPTQNRSAVVATVGGTSCSCLQFHGNVAPS